MLSRKRRDPHRPSPFCSFFSVIGIEKTNFFFPLSRELSTRPVPEPVAGSEEGLKMLSVSPFSFPFYFSLLFALEAVMRGSTVNKEKVGIIDALLSLVSFHYFCRCRGPED